MFLLLAHFLFMFFLVAQLLGNREKQAVELDVFFVLFVFRFAVMVVVMLVDLF